MGGVPRQARAHSSRVKGWPELVPADRGLGLQIAPPLRRARLLLRTSP